MCYLPLLSRRRSSRYDHPVFRPRGRRHAASASGGWRGHSWALHSSATSGRLEWHVRRSHLPRCWTGWLCGSTLGNRALLLQRRIILSSVSIGRYRVMQRNDYSLLFLNQLSLFIAPALFWREYRPNDFSHLGFFQWVARHFGVCLVLPVTRAGLFCFFI